MNLNIKNVVLMLIVVMMGSFLIAGLLGAASIPFWGGTLINAPLAPYNEVHQFTAEQITQLDVSTINTDINFIVTEDDTIKAHLYGEVTPDALPAEFARQSGSRLTVTARPRSGINNSRIRLTLDLYVPAQHLESVQGETVSGDMKLTGLNIKKLEFYTVSGDMDIRDLSLDTLQFKSVSGRLRAEDVSAANTNLNTTSGNLEITGLDGNLIAKTVSGDVTVDYNNFDNDITFDTTSGKTSLTLPEKAQFTIRLNTVSGKVDSEFPLTVTSSSSRSFEGRAGDSANRIFIKSVSGSVDIYRK
ncbi:MAG: DUF4097 family beta strand repeat-containing protein [Bacillota bacterium]|nr:DUF4097 family beta strand repeat-containing protein [Bacillota bacterium]MDW7683684.1 DUF4097 family beta strand repeat-containing protein [Bacillota bacterium]